MELSQINLNLLLSLYHLLRTHSVTQAADLAHISQPAMSRNLSQLREIFADPLMVRVGNDMHLTPRGESIWQQLPPTLNQLEALFTPNQFEPAGYQGQFNVASTDYVTQELAPSFLAELQKNAPGIGIHFHLWKPSMMDSLRQGRLDLACCYLDQVPDDIYGRQVGSDGFCCLMSIEHPLAQTTHLTLDDYMAAEHLAVTGGGDKIRAVDGALARLNLHRQLKVTVPFIHSALAITARSDYLLTLPQHIANDLGYRYNLQIRELPQELEIGNSAYYMIWHHRMKADPAHRYLRETLFNTVREEAPHLP
ncbi:LysR family transcriptional regulator [Pontibacterium sp. N1Y112]|uniref:LysR family transcriptional regulator n=1 Tax=Pontibacterium sinense TaxID=2781979 RepID=A0A8J7FCC3_9GAMM|nr:LysR family transcriptional regulator [Pontibacterium sinense]MBE9397086.1 LysR family transcriptional regulator [Pontibacterium sinense]